MDDGGFKASSFSGGGACVEVRVAGDGGAEVRHSRFVGGCTLTFTAQEWAAFLDGVRAGEFDPE